MGWRLLALLVGMMMPSVAPFSGVVPRASAATAAGDESTGAGAGAAPGAVGPEGAAGSRAPAGTGKAVAQRGTPAAVVQGLHDALLSLLRDAQALGYEGRFRRIAPVVETAFDLRYMAEKVVGRHWKRLSSTEQERWVLTFGQFTKANYAGRFDRDSGQAFELLGNEDGAHGTAIVRTRLLNPGGENVNLAYRLRSTPSGWKVIDIYLKDTVSELALRRSEYTGVLERDGFDSLLRSVEGRIAELSAGASAH